MECSCQIECEADEPCTLLRQKVVAARKEHACDECRKPILPKAQYQYDVYVAEGEVFTHKTCMDCKSLIDVFFCGWSLGSVLDDVEQMVIDQYGNVPENCIVELTPDARAWVCELIEKEWESEEK